MSPARRTALPPSAYTEAEWQSQVQQIADLYGWDYCYHVVRSKFSAWGWPDLVLLRRRDRRIVFAELKRDGGKLSPEQMGVMELLLEIAGGGWTDHGFETPADPLGMARVDVETWWPGDVDRVMEVLR